MVHGAETARLFPGGPAATWCREICHVGAEPLGKTQGPARVAGSPGCLALSGPVRVVGRAPTAQHDPVGRPVGPGRLMENGALVRVLGPTPW